MSKLEIALIIMIIFLTACQNGQPAFTEKQRQLIIAREKEQADLRLDIFNKCMDTATKIERQGDDDVSDIIYACSTISSRMSHDLTEYK